MPAALPCCRPATACCLCLLHCPALLLARHCLLPLPDSLACCSCIALASFQSSHPCFPNCRPQVQIILQLVGGRGCLTTVGDPKQSIFGFLNAVPNIFSLTQQ